MHHSAPDVGAVIRKVRLERSLSLDKTEKLTGVSKAMLGQIERGESSPTISTLWKISTGLRISFSALMGGPPSTYSPVSVENITPIREDDGKMLLYDLFPFDPASGFEIFSITVLPGCCYESPTHANVREEYILVTEGELRLTLGQQAFPLKKGMAIKFRGDEPHTYANVSGENTTFQNILVY